VHHAAGEATEHLQSPSLGRRVRGRGSGRLTLRFRELGDVLNAADEPRWATVLRRRDSGIGAEHPDTAVRPRDPIRDAWRGPHRSGCPQLLRDVLAVLAMYASEDVVGGRGDLSRLKAQKAERVVRPPEHICRGLPIPAPGVGESLGLIEHGALGGSRACFM
jgi:hypothetical protein